jgi:hypothetical protein
MSTDVDFFIGRSYIHNYNMGMTFMGVQHQGGEQR